MAMYFVLRRAAAKEFREGAVFCSQSYNKKFREEDSQ